MILSQPGKTSSGVQKRIDKLQLTDYRNEGYPVIFWDLFGTNGHPVRTTVTEMGPLLLSRLLALNDTQEGVLNVVFSAADDEGMLLLDLKDLRSMLNFAGENTKEISIRYGRITTASIGAIQRRLLVLEKAGGELFFKPAGGSRKPAVRPLKESRCTRVGTPRFAKREVSRSIALAPIKPGSVSTSRSGSTARRGISSPVN